MLEHYMLQSEQLDTRLVLAADDKVAAGLLIQRLPVEGEGNLRAGAARNEDEIGLNEDYNRIAHLAATLTREELLALDADTILRRLFWEEKLLRFAPRGDAALRVHLLARARGRMLTGLGREEVDSIVAERGEVEIGCEFCGAAVPLRRGRRRRAVHARARPAAVVRHRALTDRIRGTGP